MTSNNCETNNTNIIFFNFYANEDFFNSFS